MDVDQPYADAAEARPEADHLGSRAAGDAAVPPPLATSAARDRSPIRLDDADVLLDVPRLAVEELTLEFRGSIGIEQLSVVAKGLDADLLLKADLADLASLLGGQSRKRAPDVEGSARDAGSREQAGDDEDGESDADEGDRGNGRHRRARVERIEAVGRRALDAARHKGKAAGVAAGVAAAGAGGVLLESKLGAQRRPANLPLPQRHRGPRERLVRGLQRRLPD